MEYKMNSFAIRDDLDSNEIRRNDGGKKELSSDDFGYYRLIN